MDFTEKFEMQYKTTLPFHYLKCWPFCIWQNFDKSLFYSRKMTYWKNKPWNTFVFLITFMDCETRSDSNGGERSKYSLNISTKILNFCTEMTHWYSSVVSCWWPAGFIRTRELSRTGAKLSLVALTGYNTRKPISYSCIWITWSLSPVYTWKKCTEL